MKPTLQAGATLTRRIVVDRERTLGLMGEDARVYGTAAMILDMERVCRDLILEHADPGEDSVGIEVAVKHLAPTLPGMAVEITARVTTVEGRKVTFDVSARDRFDLIGTGIHTEFVVSVDKHVERIRIKAARAAQEGDPA